MDLTKAINVYKYLESYSEEQKNNHELKINQTLLSQETVEKLKLLKEKVSIVVFSESYCPDCFVVVPILMKIAEQNNKINLYFMPRNGNENLLTEYTGKSRIPTIMVFSYEEELKGEYIEFPIILKKDMIGRISEEIDELIEKYRMCKYNDLVEKEIVTIVIG